MTAGRPDPGPPRTEDLSLEALETAAARVGATITFGAYLRADGACCPLLALALDRDPGWRAAYRAALAAPDPQADFRRRVDEPDSWRLLAAIAEKLGLREDDAEAFVDGCDGASAGPRDGDDEQAAAYFAAGRAARSDLNRGRGDAPTTPPSPIPEDPA